MLLSICYYNYGMTWIEVMATMASSKLTNLAELIVINEFNSRKKQSAMAPYRAHMLSVVHDNYGIFFPTSRAAATSATPVVLECR